MSFLNTPEKKKFAHQKKAWSSPSEKKPWSSKKPGKQISQIENFVSLSVGPFLTPFFFQNWLLFSRELGVGGRHFIKNC